MTRQQIAYSNARALCALASIRLFGRDAGLMAELRDGLNTRRAYREIARAGCGRKPVVWHQDYERFIAQLTA